MKTIIIIGLVVLSIILVIALFVSVKREHYNAVSPNWAFNSLENSPRKYTEQCIAKPGKFFKQC